MAPQQTSDTWAELAARLQRGDEGALADILRSVGPAVAGVLKGKFDNLLGRDDIDDVLAIALYRLWQCRQQFDDSKGSLRVWFYRIAENAARDVLKHAWHKAKRLEISVDQHDVFAVADNGKPANSATPAFNGKVRQTVYEIMNRLPDAQQRIVVADAHCRDGVASSRWLADELGISPGSVRVYRKRALEAIRSELAKAGLLDFDPKDLSEV